MRAEYETQLEEQRSSLETLERLVSGAQAEAGTLHAELVREREEGSLVRDALQADLDGHRSLVEELERSRDALKGLIEEKESEAARVHEDAELAKRNAEELRANAEEAVVVLQRDLEGHRAVVSAHAEEMELARRALAELEGRYGEELLKERAAAADVLRRTNEDLEGHRAVLVELREELDRNVTVRESVEGDLRRVEELSSEIEAELQRTKGALEGSVREQALVKEELEKTSYELDSEKETQVFLRAELSSRWKSFVRAVWPTKRRY